jgi:hypothetical protein
MVLAQAESDEKSDKGALRKRKRETAEDDDGDDDDEGRRARCPPGQKPTPRRGRGGDRGGCVAR